MTEWFAENRGTIIVFLIVAFCVALVIRKLVRDRRKGKLSCGCGCANCAMHGMCHMTNCLKKSADIKNIKE